MENNETEQASSAVLSTAGLDAADRREIWHIRDQIVSARTEKQREAMEEYDRTVYYPAKQKLYALCGERGHHRGHRTQQRTWMDIYLLLAVRIGNRETRA